MINNQNIPHLIKYMGAKREILEYVTDAIQDLEPIIQSAASVMHTPLALLQLTHAKRSSCVFDSC